MEKGKLGTILCSRLDIPENVKSRPWYKERLDLKYAQQLTDTSNWTFVKNGLDDYRDGIPPKLDASIVIKQKKGIQPNIVCSDLYNRRRQPCQRFSKRLDAYDVLYSKTLPNQRKRLECINGIEDRILKKPLVYSPEQNDLPSKVIQDVSEILKISTKQSNNFMHDKGTQEHFSSLTESAIAKGDFQNVDEETRRAYNLYKKHSSSLNSSEVTNSDENQQSSSNTLPSEMDKVGMVTMEFCNWVKSIGGEGNNVKEDTIKELFVCAYEGDPSTSAVQTMNLSTIPSELLTDAHQSRHTCIKRNVGSRGTTKTTADKLKYGAWYLPPKTWKARPANTLLEDERKNDDDVEPKEKRDEIDKLLPSLHSAQTFLNFSLDKNYIRKPKLLCNVELNENYQKNNKEYGHNLPNISE